MKSRVRTLIVDILSFLSRKNLAKFDPYIIAVTGNIGKTTTKDYIFNFLNYKFANEDYSEVRGSEKSQNSEFGVNLTILGEKNAWSNPFGWLKIIIKGFFKLWFDPDFPKIFVLEVGADKPGDIRFITSIIKPDLVVLTAFQKSPTHGEFFLNIDQHINEKRVLIEEMKDDGVIVYNYDDEVMRNMAQDKKKENEDIKIYSFGFNENSNVRILECSNLYNEDAEILGLKIKLRIKLESLDEDLELRLIGVLGDAQAYSLAASVCVAILSGLRKPEILEAVRDFNYAKSRMRILDGINNSKIIDDSYNSSPKAAQNAIETISKILAKNKKIGILGHMAELGDKTKDEHFNIGLLASKVFDMIILTGRYNEYFLEGIREGKFDLGKVFMAKNPKEVLEIIEENNLIKANDIILIKGSQSTRLEKVVVTLLSHKEDAEEVCRQDVEWHKIK